jgi:endonuclease G, mitochondrial
MTYRWLPLVWLPIIGIGGIGCKTKPPVTPPPVVQQPPAIYSGDRSGNGGLLKNQPPPKPGTPAENMALGNPDGATSQPSRTTNFLVVRKQLALSYNDDRRYPNWVSWKLDADDIGSTPRGQFHPDDDLPFRPVTPGDYTNSGFDRGHNCPSKDRSASKDDNDAVFSMANMTPQLHEMNAGPWERLESYTRTLVQQRGMTCYVVCGHVGEQGRTRGGVAIPMEGWKVVVAVPRGKPIDASARVIAVQIPNDDPRIERDPWEKYIVTPAELEQAIQLPVFSALPPDLANVLRNKRDKGGGSLGGDAGFAKRNRRNGRRSGGSFGQ